VKVVIAHNRYVSANPSGENIVVDTEIQSLTAAGVEVLEFQRSSDDIATLPAAQKALLPVSPIYARAAQRELAALLDAERPDVLHLHNPYPLLSPWVVRTAHAHGVPVVQTVHNFRHVCVNGLYFRDGKPCHDCFGKAFPLPAVKHACYRGSRPQSALMAASLTVHRGTWKSVDRYLALTPAIADHVRSFGIPDDRITVKPNSVPDPGSPQLTDGAPTPSGLLFVGRLSAEKGLGLLLAAWSRHPEGALGVLRIAGDGPLRAEVETAAAHRADVVHLGRLTPDEVRAAMRASAALVTPSTWDEVCPMVVVEALANGRPVLATAMGGLPFLVDADGPEPAGWVVPPEPAALASAFPDVVASAPGMVGAARRRYEAVFAPKVVTHQLIGVYEQLAHQPRTHVP
jgi:glycosyltransferase involved in cell wall biosynthesis